jgi:ABC-2 type transport system permease protein
MRQGFSMSKVMRVAGREFASTALTKGFIIGALVVPAVLVAIIPLIGVLAATAKPPAVTGTVLVIDRSGEVYDTLTERLSEDAIRERRQAAARRAAEFAEGTLGAFGSRVAGGADEAIESIPIPGFRFELLDPTLDPEAAKERIRQQLKGGTDAEAEGVDRVLAIVEIDANAVARAEENAEFGGWQPFFRPRLNSEAAEELRDGVAWSIRERRYSLAGMDRVAIRTLDSIDQRAAQQVTQTGVQRDTSGLASMGIPVAAMILMLVATFTGGQYLLTTTIEEKSSRVVEVLLSAVSPMELMTGKILGQMGVGLSLLVIYNSIGIFALVAFSVTGLVSWQLLVSFFVFFALAYFMFAAMMAAIGAAVNDLREAQSLMTPVMLFSMVPYFLFFPVIRAPNSMLSTVLSFLPPISPFIMIMRIASPEPVPAWQVAGSIVVNLIGVVVLLWLAAKVFRVGLLMYGKPPNFRTLLKWIRMA